MLTHVILGRIAATQPVYELPSTQERNTNNIRTHPNPGYTNNIRTNPNPGYTNNIRTNPNPGYGVHHLEEIQISTGDYDYI